MKARSSNPREARSKAGEFDEDFFYDASDNDVLDQRLLDIARNGDIRPNDKGPGWISRYDFGPGNEIGWKKGRRTSVVEVVIYPNGNIWTAYPTT